MKYYYFGNRYSNYKTGGVTVAYDENTGNIGYSMCSPRDSFSNKIGKSGAIYMLETNPVPAFNPEFYPSPSYSDIANFMERVLKKQWCHIKWIERFVNHNTLFGFELPFEI